MAINNKAAITTNERFENYFPYDVAVEPFMRWLIDGCKQVVTMLREGMYNVCVFPFERDGKAPCSTSGAKEYRLQLQAV